ncbi:MAG: leucine-rich repeat domain-containing protein [Prevotella sp.]|nr:leucine-rich repeat domain-containing protein [Prevotella sp.]
MVIPDSVTYNGTEYSVTSIGNDAFYKCSGLTSVTIPNSVTSIRDYAFSGCSGLTSVTIPNSVTSIGWGAFDGCSGLTSVTIPNSVTSIGHSAFYGCSGLTSVTIPNSVTSIGWYAFEGCSGITLVKVPVTDLASFCENKAVGLISSNIGKPVQLIAGDGTEIKEYVVPEGVASIGSSAFRNCTGLTSVTIPNSVTSIGDRAFQYCSGLTSVTIGSGVTSIGDYAFSGCSGLTSVTIPGSVTSMGSSPFSGCSGITLVKVPVTDYASFCENKAVGLIYSNIGKPVQLIDGDATEIKEYVVPDGVASIGSSAFRNCTGLTSVTIPGSVKSIGNYAFRGCTSIMSVKSFIAEPFNVTGLFANETYRQGTLYVPAGTKDLYIRYDGWREFLKIEEMGDTPGPIGDVCATPTIYVVGKKFVYECDTPGAEFESILSTEEERSKGNEFVMENKTIKYTLTVYATAEGYERSEPAKISFVIDRNDVNQDGMVDVADIATIIDKMAGKARIQEDIEE